MIGTTLDKYEVLQKIGEGGMATVYRGRHTTLDRDVAIKVLHPHLSSSNRNRQRFAREARAIENLRHGNILEIFDYSGTDCDDCYIITEFVEGQTLTSLMEHVGRMPSEVVAQIGMELCEALSYAHTSGILHRDLKPDNVMVRQDGRVKLMDFGIARFLDESQVTMTGALVGSPAFMSPEQAREESLDARSDLFSLGTLLFYLVTGHFPFSGSNPSVILKNIIEGNRPAPVELAPTMSASLSDAIERLLEPSPDDRFNDAHQAREALAATLDEVGLTPSDTQWSTRAYIEDPEAFTERLESWLAEELVSRGRTLMDAGDHLAALRLYNRILSIDDENTEVLAVVQGMHDQGGRGTDLRPGWLVVLPVLLVAVVAVSAGWLVWHYRGEAVEPTTPVATPQPPVEVPAPSPVVDIEPVPDTEPVAVEPDTEARPRVRRPIPAPTRRITAPAPQLTAHAPIELPSEPGYVTLNTGNFSAYVYEDDEKLGFTRQQEPFELTPGVHLLTLRSTATLERQVEVAVSSGETRSVVVELLPRPATVFIPPEYADSCRVNRNGQALGTVGELSRNVSVPRPDRRVIIVLDCGEERVYSHTFEAMRQLNESFPSP